MSTNGTEAAAVVVELHVTMPDGSVWAVPADLVADSRARFYVDTRGDRQPGETWSEAYDRFYGPTLADDADLLEWAANDMNWSDVEHAARVVTPPAVDYQQGWVNGDTRVVRPT